MLRLLLILAVCGPLLSTLPARAQGDCLAALEVPGCKFGLPEAEYNALLPQMEAMPAPPVAQIGVDPAELRRYSFWQIDRTNVTFYDSPGGIATETANPGYSFVIPRSQVEGWMEIEPGKWVSKSNLSGTRASAFTGVTLGGPLPYPMAWVLKPTKPANLPGHSALKSAPLLAQYTRVNIFKTVVVGEWEWYLVGPGQWIEQRRVGRLIPTAPPPGAGGRWVGVDLYEQVLIAYEGGTPVFATLVASGLRQWPTTQGLFTVWAKMRTDGMSGSMGKPDQYSIPVVPYVMYFNGSQALHGTFWHDGFGYRHSHGCVNLTVGDAAWMFDWVSEGTPVYVYQSR